MGFYLQGAGGAVWHHDYESLDDLPEYARVQLRTGELAHVPEPENARDLNASIRPRDTDPKSRWSAYIRSMGQPVGASDESSMSRKEMIEWADELETEQKTETRGKK